MALNNNKERYLKLIKRTIIIVLLLLVAVVNVAEFKRLISTNPQKITEYQTPKDVYADFRNPVLAISYYAVPEGELSAAVVPPEYFNKYLSKLRQKKREEKQIQKIIVGIKTDDDKATKDFDTSLLSDIPVEIFTYQTLQDTKLDALLSAFKTEGNVLILVESLQDEIFSNTVQVLEKTAKKLLWRPVVKDLSRRKDVSVYEEKKHFTNSLTQEQQYENLKSFVNDYQKTLAEIVRQAMAGETKSNNRDDNLSDKAAVYVLAVDAEKNKFEEYGSVMFENSVYDGVFRYVSKAKKNMPEADMKIYLLTESVCKNYAGEKDFAEDLSENDGVLLVAGERKGILLPYFWRQYPDKKDFINQLKLKSGLSPDFWSEKINIYYFRAVEIPYHEN